MSESAPKLPRIPVAGPSVSEKEVAYVADAARSCWYGGANAYVDRFEKAFAVYLGVEYAVSLPHCTTAIHLALAALGVGPGDEVIVPDLTWIASAAPITYVGATPVFADIDPETWCLSAESFEACITPKTKAAIPVDLYGNLPAWDRLREVATRHGIPIIEDAAEAIGSVYHGRKAGSLGDVGVFSFHGSKTLTTGEGGMLVTGRRDLHDRVRILRDHGRAPGDRFFFNAEVAYKAKMSDLQAAFGLAQLERIDELVGKKRAIFGWYAEELAGIPGVQLNPEPAGTTNSYWMSTVVLDDRFGLTKRTLMGELETRGIDTRPLFHPLTSLPAYANAIGVEEARRRNTVSSRIASLGINLPSALSLERSEVSRVAAALRDILAVAR